MARPKFISDRKQLEKLAPVTQAPIKHHVFVCATANRVRPSAAPM